MVIISGSMNYHQTRKSSKVMGGFGQLVPQSTVVIRDGQFRSIAAEDLVPGDILRVKGGDKIPADMRIIHCSGMKVCLSCLCALPLTHPHSTICVVTPFTLLHERAVSTIASQHHPPPPISHFFLLDTTPPPTYSNKIYVCLHLRHR